MLSDTSDIVYRFSDRLCDRSRRYGLDDPDVPRVQLQRQTTDVTPDH